MQYAVILGSRGGKHLPEFVGQIELASIGDSETSAGFANQRKKLLVARCVDSRIRVEAMLEPGRHNRGVDMDRSSRTS